MFVYVIVCDCTRWKLQGEQNTGHVGSFRQAVVGVQIVASVDFGHMSASVLQALLEDWL